MNLSIQTYAQPSWTNSTPPMLANSNNFSTSNFSEHIKELSNRVLPILSNADQRYGIKPNTQKIQLENSWTHKLKISKRDTSAVLLNHDIIYPEQGRLACKQGRRFEGSLPESRIQLNTTVLDDFNKNVIGINTTNKDGLTPLMVAVATSNNAEDVRSLLDGGAMVNLQDNEGNTALMWVLRSLHNFTSLEFVTAKLAIIDVLKEYNADLNLQGTEGFTPLMITALSNNIEAFMKLKSRALNLDLQNNAGDTALHLAVRYCTKGKILKYLLRNAPKKPLKNNSGHSPFMLACFQGRYKIMDYFINNGADIDEKDNNKWSPLMHVTNCNYEKTVIYLLEKNANVVYKNPRNETARTIAEAKQNDSILRLILRKGIEYHVELFRRDMLIISGLYDENDRKNSISMSQIINE